MNLPTPETAQAMTNENLLDELIESGGDGYTSYRPDATLYAEALRRFNGEQFSQPLHESIMYSLRTVIDSEGDELSDLVLDAITVVLNTPGST